MSTTNGVTKNERMNVPVKPMRRWLPQTPTRMQNNMYTINAIVSAIAACFLSAPRATDPTLVNTSS